MSESIVEAPVLDTEHKLAQAFNSPIKNRVPLAFDFENVLDAKGRLPLLQWRYEVDVLLQFYTQEYIFSHPLNQKLTEYSYRIIKDDSDKPISITSWENEAEDILESFIRGIQHAPTPTLKSRAFVESQAFAEKIRRPILEGKYKDQFFVWISPPGDKSDGFSTHNFTFIGHVLEDRVDMVAYKNWLKPSQNSQFINLFAPDNQRVDQNPSTLNLLAHPTFIPKEKGYKSHLDIIYALTPQEQINDHKYERRPFLSRLRPSRKAIIEALELEKISDAVYAKRAHDNFALALAENRALDYMDNNYWYSLPPLVLRGGCGFSDVLGGNDAPWSTLTWFGAEMALNSEKIRVWRRGSCIDPDCRSPKNTEVAQCHICKNCEAKYDRLEIFKRLTENIWQRSRHNY